MSVFRPFCKMEYVRRESVIIYMKYFTTSWSLETLITHFFVLTIYAIFENYLIVIPKHVPEYFQVIEHVPRFGSPHCPWHWQWNDRSFWMPQGLYSAITYNQNWLIDCLSIGGQVFVRCAYPSLMYSYLLSSTYCIYYAHAHVTWYLGIFACWHKVSLVAAIF